MQMKNLIIGVGAGLAGAGLGYIIGFKTGYKKATEEIKEYMEGDEYQAQIEQMFDDIQSERDENPGEPDSDDYWSDEEYEADIKASKGKRIFPQKPDLDILEIENDVELDDIEEEDVSEDRLIHKNVFVDDIINEEDIDRGLVPIQNWINACENYKDDGFREIDSDEFEFLIDQDWDFNTILYYEEIGLFYNEVGDLLPDESVEKIIGTDAYKSIKKISYSHDFISVTVANWNTKTCYEVCFEDGPGFDGDE